MTPKVNVTVYDNTSGQLVPFGTIDKGKKFAVVKDFGNWYEVNLAGRYGYVRKSEITITMLPDVARTKIAQKTDQIITVVGNGTAVTVEYWSKNQSGNWIRSFSTNGYVGSAGIGRASESSKRTPKGAFKLGYSFGFSNPGTKMPFKQITKNSYWISNVNDKHYNTWQERTKSHPADEHLSIADDFYQACSSLYHSLHSNVPVLAGLFTTS